MVGISTMTLQRIETGKTSPSVSVLANIAARLGKQIGYFFPQPGKRVIVIAHRDQSVVESSSGMKLTILAPADLTDRHVLVNAGEAKEGLSIDPHTEEGHSLVYVVEGEAVLTHDGTDYFLKKGDTVYYDARFVHSLRTLSKRHRFFSIFFDEKKKDMRHG